MNKIYIRAVIQHTLRGNIKRFLPYMKCQKLIFLKMNDVELYKQGGEENVYEWVKRRNMEHVVCRRFMKEEGSIFDLHNLYLANSKENGIRSDMPFHYQKPRTFQRAYYVKDKKDQIAILASIAYISFMYPNLYVKYFTKMITFETFYEWMYKNPHITEDLVKRNEQIYKIQGNRNPVLQYPFLYQIMFEEDWSGIRWIENIKALYWSYKWRMIYVIHPLSLSSERTSSGFSFCNK